MRFLSIMTSQKNAGLINIDKIIKIFKHYDENNNLWVITICLDDSSGHTEHFEDKNNAEDRYDMIKRIVNGK